MKAYPRSFWLASFSMFLFMVSFNLILPEMNDFISRLGGGEQKGLIYVFFTISSALSRPFAGRLSDFIGRKRVMYFGIFMASAVTLFYPLCFSLWIFFSLRFLHGISVGFTPTGATALITDLLPSENRGTAMGVWGTFISLGIGVGQVSCTPIVKFIGLDNLFLLSSLLTFLSSLILLRVKESLELPEKFKRRLLILGINDVFEPPVMPAAIVMFLSAFTTGIIFVISPDFSRFLHIDNKGWFFLFYVFTTIIIRLLTGRLSDLIGRRQTLLIGMAFLLVSMITLAFTRNAFSYTLASVFFGLATGITSPTLFAWTADLSHPKRRGVGSGTLFICMEFGIAAGSISTMFLFNNTLESIFYTFAIGAFMAFISLIYLLWHLRYRYSST